MILPTKTIDNDHKQLINEDIKKCEYYFESAQRQTSLDKQVNPQTVDCLQFKTVNSNVKVITKLFLLWLCYMVGCQQACAVLNEILLAGGDYKRTGNVQYVPVIQADVPARTTFIEICNHGL